MEHKHQHPHNHKHGHQHQPEAKPSHSQEHKSHNHKPETASKETPGVRHTEHSSHKMKEDKGHHDHSGMIEDFKKRFYVSMVLTIPVLILSPMIQHFLGLGDSLRFNGDLLILFILSTIIYIYGGYPFLTGMYDDLVRKGKPGMMTLIAIAITTAYIYSSFVTFGLKGEVFFWELATLIDIMLIGHWIEMRSVQGASRALEELARLLPSDAHKLSADGSVTDIPLESLKKGDNVLVKPGEKIPADGIVTEGKTTVNESMLTGESKPVKKETGSEVIGGSINGEGSLKIEVKRTGEDSFLSQVIELVNQAQQSKSRTQHLADRAAFYLTLVAIFAGAATFFLWQYFSTENLAFALERTVTVMVITCPHALGLAVPLVVAVSTSLAARNGFLIRNRTAFENARNITAVVFDKTGTLTEGTFGVTDVISFNQQHTKEKILETAASLESHSQHPIAQGIIKASKTQIPVSDFNSITGKGVEGKLNGTIYRVVSPGYLRENRLSVPGEVDNLYSQGKTVVFVLEQNNVIGAIALGDKIRPESKSAVQKLKAMGIKCYLLTGDNKQTAEYVTRELQLDTFLAEVLPDQKSAKIREIQQQGFITAMTGDGVNDAPALAQADVGIAIGAGSDVAVETADIILIGDNPNDVANVIGLARATYRKMLQNLWWAAGYNVFAIPLAAGVLYSAGLLLSPALGAVLMSASTVVVAINARLLKL